MGLLNWDFEFLKLLNFEKDNKHAGMNVYICRVHVVRVLIRLRMFSSRQMQDSNPVAASSVGRASAPDDARCGVGSFRRRTVQKRIL